MTDVLTVIAAVEWIVVGLITFHQLKKLNRRMNEALDELREEMRDD